MTDKLVLKSSHEVIYTIDVADVESIFYCKPTDPDILTVLMKDGKRLYCDEVCPIDFLQENPVCAFSTNRYTDEDRKILCEDCEEDCEYAQKKEPISKLWHDSSEEPNDKSSCLIHYIVGGEVSYRDIFPVIYNKEVREFVSESYPQPTGYKVEQSSLEGGVVAEVYKDMRDRFPLSDIYKWAYIDDILNLSNIERTVKDWKEEPVSEDLEKEIEQYCIHHGYLDSFKDCGYTLNEQVGDIACHFADWQKEQIEKALLSEVLPCFMHDGEADEVVAKLDEVLNQKK